MAGLYYGLEAVRTARKNSPEGLGYQGRVVSEGTRWTQGRTSGAEEAEPLGGRRSKSSASESRRGIPGPHGLVGRAQIDVVRGRTRNQQACAQRYGPRPLPGQPHIGTQKNDEELETLRLELTRAKNTISQLKVENSAVAEKLSKLNGLQPALDQANLTIRQLEGEKNFHCRKARQSRGRELVSFKDYLHCRTEHQ